MIRRPNHTTLSRHSPVTGGGLRTRLLLPCLLVSALLLTGCLDVQVRIALREDGGGTAAWDMEIPPATAAAGMTALSLQAELEKNEHFRRPGVRFTQSRSPEGNEVLSALVPFDDVSALSSNEMQAGFRKDPGDGRCAFSVAGIMAVPIPVRVDIVMPGKILKTNADSVSGNTARFENLLRPEGLYVESEAREPWFGLGPAGLTAAAAVLLLAIAGLVVARRKLFRQAAAPAATRVPPAAPLEYVYCGRCGARNKSSARFCKRCGVLL